MTTPECSKCVEMEKKLAAWKARCEEQDARLKTAFRDLDIAESRKSGAFLSLRARAEQAEAALAVALSGLRVVVERLDEFSVALDGEGLDGHAESAVGPVRVGCDEVLDDRA